MLERVASRRFIKEINALSNIYPDVVNTLSGFLEFKCARGPMDSYGKKDYPFRNGKLRGFRHFHISHGKIILVYWITKAQLRLCCIVSHKAIDGTPSATLISYLDGLVDEDFHPIIV
jgi:mRNA-degrading endonuclease YafQ of YafQ-DinJ toxin-antitoxin module